jgi:hypothetical protein
MYVTCKKSTTNLQLIDNLIVSPDTSTLSLASYADLNAVSGSFWIEEAIDCLRAISNGMISVDNSYIQIEVIQ